MELEKIIRNKHSGDSEQLKFIFSDDKNIIVTAPAGCGKTTAMVSKIARELSIDNIPSNKKVLAMTFSINAAMKIKDSLKTLLLELVDNTEQYLKKVDVANYHNFAMKLLYKHGYIINNEFLRLSEFEVIDEDRDEEKSRLYKYIIKSEYTILENFCKSVKNSDEEGIISKMKSYWDILNEKLIPNHIITYNGILVSAIKLLENEQLSRFYKEYYHMIIIDEFQDTNLLSYKLIKRLIDNNKVIFMGDNLQKIYGFLGAVNGILEKCKNEYSAKEIKFQNNYRFTANEEMKKLEKLIRSYGDNYNPSKMSAIAKLKSLNNDRAEDTFIVDGIEKIIADGRSTVAVLVRLGFQGNSIAQELDKRGVKYFNSLFSENDFEPIKFYEVAIDEFHKATVANGKATKKNLDKCLQGVADRNKEIYLDDSRKFIYDALYKLLKTLFIQSKKWKGTLKDRYDIITFTLKSNGLRHMIEFINESVILTTIHSAKGLEWDYVILPKLNSYAFPNRFMCNPCIEHKSCLKKINYCKFLFENSMKTSFKEEISIFYVAITRAKRNVYMTVNTGPNIKQYKKQTSCFVNLDGLLVQDYSWDNLKNLD